MVATIVRLTLIGLLGVIPLFAYGYYWERYTSEELPPSTCSSFGDFVSGGSCSRSYCDNVRVECNATQRAVRSRVWTRQISEEKVSDFCASVSDGSQRCDDYVVQRISVPLLLNPETLPTYARRKIP